MKRVVMLCEYFPAREEEITGGVEKRAYEFVQHNKNSFAFDILTSRTKTKQKKIEKISENITIHRTPFVNPYTTKGNVLRRLMYIIWSFFVAWNLGIKRKRKEQTIITGENFIAYLPAIFAGLLSFRKSVITYHETWLGMWISHKGLLVGTLGTTYELLVLLCRPRIIAVSEFTANKLARFGFPSKKISVVPNGIHIPNIIQAKEKEKTFVTASRLVKTKRVDLLISAMKEFPDYKLIVFGDGPEKANLKKIVKTENLEKQIILKGWVDDEKEVYREIANASCYVTASEVEGFGINVIQAMFMQTPCVISNIEPHVEISKESKGIYYFQTGNVRELIRQLKVALTTKIVPTKPTKYTLKSVTKKYKETINRI